MAFLKTTILTSLLIMTGLAHAAYPQDFHGFANEPSVNDDRDLINANQARRNVRFLRAARLTVTRLLQDDTRGSRHQRFYVRLSDGSEVFAVYSLEDGRQRVPVREGSEVVLAGEFKWTRFGGLMHWLHEDVRDIRPDGYVEVNGVRYGKDR